MPRASTLPQRSLAASAVFVTRGGCRRGCVTGTAESALARYGLRDGTSAVLDSTAATSVIQYMDCLLPRSLAWRCSACKVIWVASHVTATPLDPPPPSAMPPLASAAACLGLGDGGVTGVRWGSLGWTVWAAKVL